eukprot:12989368-Ditylum_brightwellii.AAC.1
MLHEFDTQVNEAMNQAVSGKAPKHKTYGTTISLQNQASIAIAIQIWGKEKFWTMIYDQLQIN